MLKNENPLILTVDDPSAVPWDIETDVLVIGAGGCGLVAELLQAVCDIRKEGVTVLRPRPTDTAPITWREPRARESLRNSHRCPANWWWTRDMPVLSSARRC